MTIDSIIGLDLYAYCMNDPVNKFDPDGEFGFLLSMIIPIITTNASIGIATQVATSIFAYGIAVIASFFDSDIKQDLEYINWNPFNSNINNVTLCKKISFYKGIPIIFKEGDSFTFKCIFLSKDEFYRDSFYWNTEELLKHEFGHSIQGLTYNTLGYLFNIALPSALLDNSDDALWEANADFFGGVNRKIDKSVLNESLFYFAFGRIIGPMWWW